MYMYLAENLKCDQETDWNVTQPNYMYVTQFTACGTRMVNPATTIVIMYMYGKP